MPLAAEAFSIQCEHDGSLYRITVAGGLDRVANLRLRVEFDKALPSDAETIMVDLSRVTSLNGLAINLLRYMRRCCGSRVLIIPSAAVARRVHRAAVRTEARRRRRGPGSLTGQAGRS